MADITLNFQPELAEIGLAAFADPVYYAERLIAALECLAEQSPPVDAATGRLSRIRWLHRNAQETQESLARERSHTVCQVNTDQ